MTHTTCINSYQELQKATCELSDAQHWHSEFEFMKGFVPF